MLQFDCTFQLWANWDSCAQPRLQTITCDWQINQYALGLKDNDHWKPMTKEQTLVRLCLSVSCHGIKCEDSIFVNHCNGSKWRIRGFESLWRRDFDWCDLNWSFCWCSYSYKQFTVLIKNMQNKTSWRNSHPPIFTHHFEDIYEACACHEHPGVRQGDLLMTTR